MSSVSDSRTNRMEPYPNFKNGKPCNSVLEPYQTVHDVFSIDDFPEVIECEFDALLQIDEKTHQTGVAIAWQLNRRGFSCEPNLEISERKFTPQLFALNVTNKEEGALDQSVLEQVIRAVEQRFETSNHWIVKANQGGGFSICPTIKEH